MLRWVAIGVLLIAGAASALPPAAIAIDYPEDGSVFPPEIAPPTFLWRDGASAATIWRIDVSFADGAPSLRATSRGPRLRIGKIDPDCVSETNQLPRLTPQQAAAHTWTPDAVFWASIKRHSVAGLATLTISGFSAASPERLLSRGRVAIRVSRDPVGAPIFYRDVPLMPTHTQTGAIQPLAADAVHLIQWRLRNLAESQSRVVMEEVPVCANCHSFSADGKTLGMDLDGLRNNRGLYTLTPVAPSTSIRRENVIQWSTAQGPIKAAIRVGFMSQVSPDGRYVVTTLDESPNQASNYYVANFKDYRFLQVFFPTRGILSWYSRETGILQPLPGADDPRFVQMGGFWSPSGDYLVFARAPAQDPHPQGSPEAQFANDPNELQLQYDLYRIPFNAGRGGVPEPIAGASHNGFSNTFPKVSPDGRWIVYVQCRNGLLMRPDSQLYIVPAEGGQARRMRCNTALMNSWHSFSPNGRWLVFSSKARSPYTQMYLTHIDSDGSDSPAILIDNTTAANRAVNLPEFVNIPPDGLRELGGPAIEFYRLFDQALYLEKQRRIEESIALWKQTVALGPDEDLAHRHLAEVLLMAGRREEAATHLQKARELELRSTSSHNELGLLLLETGRLDEALAEFRQAVQQKPDSAPAHANLARALTQRGQPAEALLELRKALELDPRYAPAHYQLGLLAAQRGEAEEAIREWRQALDLDPNDAPAHDSLANALYSRGQTAEALAHWREAIRLQTNDAPALQHAAWVLATSPEASLRNGTEALGLAIHAMQLSGGKDASILDALAAAYAETNRFADAALTARRALALAPPSQAEALKSRIALYESGNPFREPPAPR
ncbi:MAG: tetratricopeptide repeat protein [Bryobacteraceae bacterium]